MFRQVHFVPQAQEQIFSRCLRSPTPVPHLLLQRGPAAVRQRQATGGSCTEASGRAGHAIRRGLILPKPREQYRFNAGRRMAGRCGDRQATRGGPATGTRRLKPRNQLSKITSVPPGRSLTARQFGRLAPATAGTLRFPALWRCSSRHHKDLRAPGHSQQPQHVATDTPADYQNRVPVASL